MDNNKRTTEGLINRNISLETRMLKVEAEIRALRPSSEKINTELNTQENRNRRWCVEINGVPYTPNEKCVDIVEKIGKLMEIENFDRRLWHKPPTIILLFKSRSNRDNFCDNKLNLKGKTVEDIGLFPTPDTDITRNKIFVNESLSVITKTIFKKVGDKWTTLRYNSCYTSNGLIYVQKIKDVGRLCINSLRDLNLII